MPQSYTFSFKLTQLPTKNQNNTLETSLNNRREDAFMALVRAIAGNPSMFAGLKDEESRQFECPNGAIYKIQYHEIRL
jgi:hypothetical protein